MRLRRLVAAFSAIVVTCGLMVAGAVPGAGSAAHADSDTDAALAAMVKPLFRARMSFWGEERTVLTPWSHENDRAVNIFGYASDGVVIYTANSPATGLSPVYRLYRTGHGDRIYTTDAAERDSWIAAGYTDQGIGHYASTTFAPGMLTVYRLAKGGFHRYAVGAAERDRSVAEGWTYETVAFHGRGSFTTALLTNGDFAAGTTGWSATGATAAAENGMLRVGVGAGVTDPALAAVAQGGKTWRARRMMTLSFDAYATTDVTIRALVREAVDPHSESFADEIALTTSPQHFSFTFDTTGETSNGEVAFHLGGAGALTAYLDNVSLVENSWTTSVTPQQTQEAALDAAAASGQLVEVLAERGETRDVYATPERTLVATEHPDPVRVNVAGAWVAVFNDLRVKNGYVVPFSSPIDLKFSNGGTTPLAQFTRDGHTIALTWPSPLPVPTIAPTGTAVYPGVFGPDVDLRVKATPEGFSHVLVVKTAAAAQDSRLATMRLGLSAPGLTITAAADGTQQAVDPVTGAVVFEAPPPLMWDSTPPPAPTNAAQPASVDTIGDEGALPPPETAATDEHPGDASKISILSTNVSGGQLTLTTDQAMLTATDTTFPVYVDPMYRTVRSSANLMVASSGFELYNFKDDQGVGRCPIGLPSSGRSCGSPHEKRLFYRMPTAWLAGKQITSAELEVKEVWSASCSKRKIELWLATSFGTNSTWNSTRDNWVRRLDTKNVAKGWSSSCPGGTVRFNAASAVREAARKGWSTTTFGLRAADPADQLGWKRFDRYAYLQVHYNTPPVQPKMSQLYSSPGGVCQTHPVRINQLPTLYAKNLTDADNHGVEGEKLKAQYRIFWTDSGGVFRTRTIGTPSKMSAYKGRGTLFSVKVPVGVIPQNTNIGWEVRAFDGAAWSPWSSAGSATGCYFVYDTTAPAPPVVSSAAYPAWDPANPNQLPTDGVGRYGRFDVTLDAQATKFAWSLNSGAPSVGKAIPKTAPTMSLDLLPFDDGMNQLYVTAWDAASNYATAVYQFHVAPGSAPKAHWKLDEPAGATSLADSAPKAAGAPVHPANPQGGYTLGASGSSGTAMALNGTTGNAATGGPVLDTGRSHSVSAWVKLANTNGFQTVVAQAGNRSSAFFLQYSHADNRWAFSVTNSDVDNPAGARALSASAPVLNTWTHLLGVYDATTRQARIYVNGTAGAPVTVTGTWTASGPLLLGRAKFNGAAADYLAGTVDDVRVFDRIVPAPEVAVLSRTKVLVMGQWHLNSASGTTSPDTNPEPSATVKRPLNLAGATRIVTGSVVSRTGQPGGMLLLPGGNGDHASAPGAILNTSESYTLSVWVRIEGEPSRSQTILSLAGTNTSSLILRYDGTTRRYTLDVRAQDTAGATAVTIQHPTFHGGNFGDWDHVAVTYDAANGELSLWVNGDLSAAPEAEVRSTRFGVYPFGAVSSLELGRARVGGAWPAGQNFAGWLDDVWLVRGTPSDDVVNMLAVPTELDNIHP